MTASSRAPSNPGGWALQIALILSALLHVAIMIGAMLSSDAAARLFNVHPMQAFAQPQNEVVTINSPLRFERRATPAPAPPPAHTLQAAHARPRPVVRVATKESDAIVPPSHFHFPSSGYAGTQPQPQTQAQTQRLSASQRALREAIARHFGRTVSAARDPASVPGRFRLRMLGIRAKLQHGQGIYYPVRGWRDGGLDYYEVAYEYIYPDGKDERGSVPWPIHFDPASDPFFSPDPQALANTPMPGPPPNFTPPGDLGKALRAYFPSLRFEDQDG